MKPRNVEAAIKNLGAGHHLSAVLEDDTLEASSLNIIILGLLPTLCYRQTWYRALLTHPNMTEEMILRVGAMIGGTFPITYPGYNYDHESMARDFIFFHHKFVDLYYERFPKIVQNMLHSWETKKWSCSYKRPSVTIQKFKDVLAHLAQQEDALYILSKSPAVRKLAEVTMKVKEDSE